ncbi:ferritin-like domain-containing protein [Motilibacter deserti]|uniref:Ferritin-like domain-containing protein n=1 Tax=Motilibacter deserti TaxID=2714956 RepID=A0ABX0GQG5_9ACTN|nr:ferritin-like domain-containing protein [Motilibacter deserti]NHC13077.1 ferritin-like domain-containing protein [Motilibacter deserti]
MFGKSLVVDMVNRSAENATDRRAFLRSAGFAGLGVAGAGALAAMGATEAHADEASDGAVLNFALNLEYLEAEFYSHAAYGKGLDEALTTGTGTRGGVVGGRRVPFKTKSIAQFATEIAADEIHHVKFLRKALGSAAVSRPAIDLKTSFTAAARAAKLIGPKQTFDPFANENNFMLAAFIFEDVGVTAYKGAAPLITNKAYLEAAAGILAVEAYHAATIRTSLWNRGLVKETVAISDARDSLHGGADSDQGIGYPRGDKDWFANIVPADNNGIAFSRTPGEVLNVVYLSPGKVTKGGFFPAGVNGAVNASGS